MQATQGNSLVAWVAVIAASVGGLIAVLSVLLQNVFLARRQREQLSHDADQRRTERAMALRREVYLEVAGATANLQEYLLTLGNPNVSAEQQSQIIKGCAAALNRAQIIGAFDTLKSLNKAQEFFGLSLIDLNLKGLAVKLAALKVSELENEAKLLFSNRMELAKTLLAQKDADIKKILEGLVGSPGEKEAEIEKQLEQARQTHLEELKTLFVASAKAGLAYNNLLIEPLILARRELNFEIDADAYHKMSVTINARIQQELETSLESMERLFDGS